VLARDGAEAELIYHREPGRLVLVHTEVPDEMAGEGIGGQLVAAAVQRAHDEGLTVVPWCPFARRWLRQHLKDLAVPIDWASRPR
jgi:predicted GNAT family acetyltransferase